MGENEEVNNTGISESRTAAYIHVSLYTTHSETKSRV